MTVSWDSLEADVTAQLPLLRERYVAQKEWWEGEPIPQHVLMGDVFLPKMIEVARNGQSADVEQLSHFLELLASSEDVRLQEIVSVTVLEFLESEPEVLEVLRHRFGLGTLRLLEERERWRNTH